MFLFIAAYAFSQWELGKIGHLEVNKGASTSEKDWNEAGVVTKVPGVVNILLVGQDTRNENERARSDSMIILSVNKNTKEINMISIMRDLYVEIPDYEGQSHGYNKLNAAYRFGGPGLLNLTLEKYLGLNIDYNVEVDFSGFKDIVDALGGIDVELNEDEVNYMNSSEVLHDMGKVAKGLEQDFTVGVNHLNGQEALCYARIRHVGNSDWGRAERQRNVIQIIFQRMKKESWPKLLKVYSSIAKNLKTDMSNTQLMSVAFSAYSMGLDKINSYVIPDINECEDVRNEKGWVVVPDWDATKKRLNDYLYSIDGGESNKDDSDSSDNDSDEDDDSDEDSEDE